MSSRPLFCPLGSLLKGLILARTSQTARPLTQTVPFQEALSIRERMNMIFQGSFAKARSCKRV
jgi:hypothetical protein